MVSLNGANAPKIEPFAEIGRIESVNPTRERIPIDRNEARFAGDRIPDKTARKASFDLSRMSEQDKEKLQEMLDKHNEQFSYTGKFLKFKFDEEAFMMYVEVIDSSTQEVIVSLPPEFLIDLSVKMKKILGLYIDEKL
jgi:flagellar protein FlaG